MFLKIKPNKIERSCKKMGCLKLKTEHLYFTSHDNNKNLFILTRDTFLGWEDVPLSHLLYIDFLNWY